ncbi:MAG: Rieske (2Fe-2S) protein [Wenyingzhuangia sp.]|jgi:nitrite reductase/ring-hydroxylating ferredoxin subunit|uniref:Rieske (2Fe-2S) protein n=1 Tax=Wenyingzhuangia sp. TaxID=1964193 RepID=UPI00321B012B
MKRKEFLKSIGAGAAFAVTFSCLGGCSNNNGDEFPEEITLDPDPITGALLTIDLSEDSSSALKKNGGYLIKNRIVVAKDLSGDYVAATVRCSHEPRDKVIFRDNEYYCTQHGARYDLEGKGLNKDGKNGLTTYTTSLEGNILSIMA